MAKGNTSGALGSSVCSIPPGLHHPHLLCSLTIYGIRDQRQRPLPCACPLAGMANPCIALPVSAPLDFCHRTHPPSLCSHPSKQWPQRSHPSESPLDECSPPCAAGGSCAASGSRRPSHPTSSRLSTAASEGSAAPPSRPSAAAPLRRGGSARRPEQPAPRNAHVSISCGPPEPKPSPRSHLPVLLPPPRGTASERELLLQVHHITAQPCDVLVHVEDDLCHFRLDRSEPGCHASAGRRPGRRGTSGNVRGHKGQGGGWAPTSRLSPAVNNHRAGGSQSAPGAGQACCCSCGALRHGLRAEEHWNRHLSPRMTGMGWAEGGGSHGCTQRRR